jgi:hypothetical protein
MIMISKLVQWVLSKVFPYKGCMTAGEPIGSVGNWEKCKLDENKDSYGGDAGTWRW